MDWRKKYEKIISSPDYVGCIFLPAGESRSCWENAPQKLFPTKTKGKIRMLLKI